MNKPLFTVLLLSLLCVFNAKAQEEPNHPVADTIHKVGEVLDGPLESIIPPTGFDTVSYFNGYLDRKTGASILVNEIHEVGFFQLESGMNDTYYSANGMEFISKCELKTVSGTKGIIYKMRFDQRGIPFIRYVVHAGDITHTLWLHVTYAERFAEELDAGILSSFESIDFYPMTTEEE